VAEEPINLTGRADFKGGDKLKEVFGNLLQMSLALTEGFGGLAARFDSLENVSLGMIKGVEEFGQAMGVSVQNSDALGNSVRSMGSQVRTAMGGFYEVAESSRRPLSIVDEWTKELKRFSKQSADTEVRGRELFDMAVRGGGGIRSLTVAVGESRIGLKQMTELLSELTGAHGFKDVEKFAQRLALSLSNNFSEAGTVVAESLRRVKEEFGPEMEFYDELAEDANKFYKEQNKIAGVVRLVEDRLKRLHKQAMISTKDPRKAFQAVRIEADKLRKGLGNLWRPEVSRAVLELNKEVGGLTASLEKYADANKKQSERQKEGAELFSLIGQRMKAVKQESLLMGDSVSEANRRAEETAMEMFRAISPEQFAEAARSAPEAAKAFGDYARENTKSWFFLRKVVGMYQDDMTKAGNAAAKSLAEVTYRVLTGGKELTLWGKTMKGLRAATNFKGFGQQLGQSAMAGLSDVGGKLMKLLSPMSILIEAFEPFLMVLENTLAPVISEISMVIMELGSEFLPIISEVASMLLEILGAILPPIMAIVRPMLGVIKWIVGALSKVVSFIAGIFTKYREIVTSFVEWMESFVPNWILTLLGISRDKKEPIKAAADTGAALVGSFSDAIEKTAAEGGQLSVAANSMMTTVADRMPHSDAKKGPLSDLSKSSLAIPEMLSEGMEKSGDHLGASSENMLSGVMDKLSAIIDVNPFSRMISMAFGGIKVPTPSGSAAKRMTPEQQAQPVVNAISTFQNRLIRILGEAKEPALELNADYARLRLFEV
jgi:hypothetical protein